MRFLFDNLWLKLELVVTADLTEKRVLDVFSLKSKDVD